MWTGLIWLWMETRDGSCEHSNSSAGSIKGCPLLDQLNVLYLVQKTCVLWS